MVAEQLSDNSELRVDVLLEGIESYRGIDVQRGFRLTFFHTTIDRRFRATIKRREMNAVEFHHRLRAGLSREFRRMGAVDGCGCATVSGGLLLGCETHRAIKGNAYSTDCQSVATR
jgi:hypothetical protein